nr:MAG TPA: hypothetical protein [Bacteriophage sp.]
MAFSITATKALSKTGFRATLIEAVKAANPSLNDLNFDDFEFNLDGSKADAMMIKSYVESGEEGYSEGMVVKPVVKMTVKDNEDIKRNYTENSYETIFTVNSPDADEFIKKHVLVENLSELSWGDYDTVLRELKKFIGSNYISSYNAIIIKEESENSNSKYIHIGFNTSHQMGNTYEDTASALLSYRYVGSETEQSFKRVLSFHFTRADVENKRDLAIDNNTLTVGESNMIENL